MQKRPAEQEGFARGTGYNVPGKVNFQAVLLIAPGRECLRATCSAALAEIHQKALLTEHDQRVPDQLSGRTWQDTLLY